MSVRTRLVVLALLAITPLVFDHVHGLELARQHRIDRARTEVIELARRGTESQRENIHSVRSLLQMVARVYANMPIVPANCNQYLKVLTGNVLWIRGLPAAGIDGRITCSTQPDAIGLNVADRDHFQNALHSRKFVLSNYMINRFGQTAAELVVAADRTLYTAKRRGRNRAVAHVPTLVSTSTPEPRTEYETPPQLVA